MTSPDTEKLLADVSQLADQLAVTIDDRFDITLQSSLNDERVLKLVMMINFILERARDNIDQLAAAKAGLEERVRERTALLELVIRGSNDGIWFWHLDDDRLEVSERFAKVIGYGADTLTRPDAWLAQVHPADREDLRMAIRHYVSGTTGRLSHQYRLRDAQQSYRWMILRGALQRDETGNPRILAGTQSDITALVAVDQESGLPNETAFDDWLDTQVTADRGSAVVAFCSIDRLGELSETLEGPDLLAVRREIRQRIETCIPMSAFLAKLQGSVYAIGLPNTGNYGLAVWDALSKAFSEPFSIPGHGALRLPISIGTTSLAPGGIKADAERVKAALWSSLRKARETEGSSLVAYDEQLREERARHLRVEADIRHALDEDRVVGFLQPIVSAGSGAIEGFEALVRVRTPDGGLMPPGVFIPVVEPTDLIIPLTERVMDQALATLRALQQAGFMPDDAFVAVNVAPQHLLGGALPDSVTASLRKAGLRPEHLKLEITETALVENMDAAIEQLQALRKIGCRIALDDFGTGYSSLEYLQTLPVDVLKLDRTFVDKIDNSEKALAIARTVCELATTLSLEIVAEGIEHWPQATRLKMLGVDLFQGFYFCEPLAPEQVAEWVAGYQPSLSLSA